MKRLINLLKSKTKCECVAPFSRIEVENGEKFIVFKCSICGKETKQKASEILGVN